MEIVVFGAGHVGLVTAGALATFGHHVVALDDDEEKIGRLRNGVCPFFEPGLEELVNRAMRDGALRFEFERREAIGRAEVVFICVGTSTRPSGEANLASVERAARGIVRFLNGRVSVVEKSSVPAGTAYRLRRVLTLARPDLAEQIDVISNPEFLREGRAVEDALRPARILVGARTTRGFETMRRLYEPLVRGGTRLIETDIATAELAKQASDAFLALKISYANALARLCERAGADVVSVADVMGSDPRIGRAFLDAGIGYGGYCFPTDLQAFESLAGRLGYDFRLLREVERINAEAIQAAFDKVKDAVGNLEDKRVALLGLSFKPGTDDVRFSPALALGRMLLEEGASVVGYDPYAGPNAKSELAGLELTSSPYAAIERAHCMVVCTEWDEFRYLDLERAKELLTHPIVVDGRNLFDPADMRARGFAYHGMGRSTEGGR